MDVKAISMAVDYGMRPSLLLIQRMCHVIELQETALSHAHKALDQISLSSNHDFSDMKKFYDSERAVREFILDSKEDPF